MKKVLMFVSCMICSLFIINVNAEEIYYTNDNGVSFTKEQYNYYTEMAWDGYQQYVTQNEFNQLVELDLFNRPIEKKTIVDTPIFKFTNKYSTKGSSLVEKGRTTVISKSCSSQCFYILSTGWNGTPYVKSWDVIGARASGTTITTINDIIVNSNNYLSTYSNPKIETNGFGYSIKLPNDTGISVSVAFYANTGGTVYGTYQHAMSNTTEAISKLYLISYSGYGGVFSFYGSAYGVYDGCNGVSI